MSWKRIHYEAIVEVSLRALCSLGHIGPNRSIAISRVRAPVIASSHPVVVSSRSVALAFAWAIHAFSARAVSPVTTVTEQATRDRTDRKNGKKCRRNELLHAESFAK
jgi:hypothetical protein